MIKLSLQEYNISKVRVYILAYLRILKYLNVSTKLICIYLYTYILHLKQEAVNEVERICNIFSNPQTMQHHINISTRIKCKDYFRRCNKTLLK